MNLFRSVIPTKTGASIVMSSYTSISKEKNEWKNRRNDDDTVSISLDFHVLKGRARKGYANKLSPDVLLG